MINMSSHGKTSKTSPQTVINLFAMSLQLDAKGALCSCGVPPLQVHEVESETGLVERASILMATLGLGQPDILALQTTCPSWVLSVGALILIVVFCLGAIVLGPFVVVDYWIRKHGV